MADLFATVADLAGAPVAPDDPYVDGRSFVPSLADPTGPEIHSVVYAEVFDADGGDHRRMIRDPVHRSWANADYAP